MNNQMLSDAIFYSNGFEIVYNIFVGKNRIDELYQSNSFLITNRIFFSSDDIYVNVVVKFKIKWHEKEKQK